MMSHWICSPASHYLLRHDFGIAGASRGPLRIREYLFRVIETSTSRSYPAGVGVVVWNVRRTRRKPDSVGWFLSGRCAGFDRR